MDDFTTGYLIGVVVGEGCFSGDGITPAMRLSMHVRDRSVLEFLCEQIGGKVHGPYCHNGRHHSSHRRRQFERWLKHYFPGLSPEWLDGA